MTHTLLSGQLMFAMERLIQHCNRVSRDNWVHFKRIKVALDNSAGDEQVSSNLKSNVWQRSIEVFFDRWGKQ